MSLTSAARVHGRGVVNALARLFGARIVNAKWGPRGFRASLERARAQGFVPATIIDVGAATGVWTRECRLVYPDARYFLVDPLEENQGHLTQLTLADPRVKVWRGALGAQAGRLQLWAHGDQSSFLRSAEYPARQREVEVRTLDSFLDELSLPPPLLLKADVQGFELEVFRGASRCLELAEMLLVEVSLRRFYEDSPLAHDVVGYLGARRFRLYDICSYVQRPGDGELIQCDIVFAREDSKLFAHEGWAQR